MLQLGFLNRTNQGVQVLKDFLRTLVAFGVHKCKLFTLPILNGDAGQLFIDPTLGTRRNIYFELPHEIMECVLVL